MFVNQFNASTIQTDLLQVLRDEEIRLCTPAFASITLSATQLYFLVVFLTCTSDTRSGSDAPPGSAGTNGLQGWWMCNDTRSIMRWIQKVYDHPNKHDSITPHKISNLNVYPGQSNSHKLHDDFIFHTAAHISKYVSKTGLSGRPKLPMPINALASFCSSNWQDGQESSSWSLLWALHSWPWGTTRLHA